MKSSTRIILSFAGIIAVAALSELCGGTDAMVTAGNEKSSKQSDASSGRDIPQESRDNKAYPCLLTFMQISDAHVGAEDNEPIHKRLRAAVKLANSLKVDLVIDTGDMANNPVHAATEHNFQQLAKYKNYMAKLKMPYYVVPGNHDIGYYDNDKDPRKVKFADGDILSSRFQKEIGPLDQSFVFHNYRFILANNNPPYGKQPGYLSERQLAWIRHELQRAAASKQKALLFLHVPVLDHSKNVPWGVSSKKLAKLVKQYNVPLVTYGHVHESHRTELDGTCYVMCPDLKVKGHTILHVYRFYNDYFELWNYDVLSGKSNVVGRYDFTIDDKIRSAQ